MTVPAGERGSQARKWEVKFAPQLATATRRTMVTVSKDVMKLMSQVCLLREPGMSPSVCKLRRKPTKLINSAFCDFAPVCLCRPRV